MSRALGLAVALGLVAALVLAPTIERPFAGAWRAAAADCTWQRHAKRVVKRVKRAGRVRRVVRVKRWWSCERTATPPLGAAPPTSAPAPSPPPTEPSGPARLSVKALEFSYTLSRPGIPAGEAIVELNNQGEDPHNLNLRLEGGEEAPLEVSEAGPLEHRTARFDLPAGTYRLWCSLPQHDEWGMNATLTVAAG